MRSTTDFAGRCVSVLALLFCFTCVLYQSMILSTSYDDFLMSPNPSLASLLCLSQRPTLANFPQNAVGICGKSILGATEECGWVHKDTVQPPQAGITENARDNPALGVLVIVIDLGTMEGRTMWSLKLQGSKNDDDDNNDEEGQAPRSNLR
ncbi:hypothetical protein BDN70DRAFT_893916 [Pholiota conissans]|uniref:Uncharacterized protein n=1 Tax=Pholiota conissans TaxID=109636 RepID=A0A9P6CUN7_9AGAR|nr:hypothetical protein BDN70DRAFT_893916 [Pholiota conissans]